MTTRNVLSRRVFVKGSLATLGAGLAARSSSMPNRSPSSSGAIPIPT